MTQPEVQFALVETIIGIMPIIVLLAILCCTVILLSTMPTNGLREPKKKKLSPRIEALKKENDRLSRLGALITETEELDRQIELIESGALDRELKEHMRHEYE